jgi:LCP family protein required for cell wall assembly
LATREGSSKPLKEENDVFGRKLKKKKPWGRVLTISGGCLLAATGGAAAWLNFTKSGHEARMLFPTMVQMYQGANPDRIFEDSGSDIVNILLIGRDVNYKEVFKNGKNVWHTYDENAKARSDTMIVVSLDRQHQTIRMVSLPRDAKVHLPDNKEGVRLAKLNAAHAYGGPELLMQTIHDELGLTIHHYAVIRFEGFKALIDKVGGIDVNVIGALKRDGTRGRLKYDDNWGHLHIDLQPGPQHLTGQQAHDYVRFRMDLEGDPGRIRRQQQVMRALAQKVKNAGKLQIPGLVNEIMNQFKTDLSNQDIASAATFAKNLGDASKIQPVTLFGVYSTRGSLLLNRSKNKKLLQYIFGSTFNPDHFLQNSPSTSEDEMGEENNSSPGARAILREAGVIGDDTKGDGADEHHVDASSSDSSDEDAATSSSHRHSHLKVAEKSEGASTDSHIEHRRHRTRHHEAASRRHESDSGNDSGTTARAENRGHGDGDSSSPEASTGDTSDESGSDRYDSSVPQAG